MARGLFITGTGTDVGKTFVSALIVKKLKESGCNVGYYKAAMSGNARDESGRLIPGDAVYVQKVSGIMQALEEMCPYIYEAAVSPHLASRLEGNPVLPETVLAGYRRVSQQCDYVTMEGSGGILCPICIDEQEIWLEDIIKLCKLPSLIVADAGLGAINSVVLTVEYMKQKGLPIKGIIFNHFQPDHIMQQDNIRMIEYRTGIKTIACVEKDAHHLTIEADQLKALFDGEEECVS